MITKTISCVLIETYYFDHNTIERKEGEREKKKPYLGNIGKTRLKCTVNNYLFVIFKVIFVLFSIWFIKQFMKKHSPLQASK